MLSYFGETRKECAKVFRGAEKRKDVADIAIRRNRVTQVV
jgi:hypothetical protein